MPHNEHANRFVSVKANSDDDDDEFKIMLKYAKNAYIIVKNQKFILIYYKVEFRFFSNSRKGEKNG